MSNRSWFYASNGQQQGPYPEAQLRDLMTRGMVGADTLVWTEGMSGWQRAGDIPGLVPGGSAPPSIPHPGGPPPVAAGGYAGGGYGGGCAVDRCRPLGPPLAQPGVRHRHRAGDSVALGRDLVLSLDRLPALRAGPAEPRLHRPAPRYLVRLHRDRRSDLCGLGRPLLPPISLAFRFRPCCPGWSFAGSPANLSSNGQPLPIAFNGSALGYVGWQVLLYVSFITIIGWAWVVTAWMRWICRNIERHAARGHLHRVRTGSAVANHRVRDRLHLYHPDSVGAALVRALVRVAIRAGRPRRS